MKLEIDNNQRIFQVTTSTGKQVFCNLHQLNEVVEKLEAQAGYFTINHFWNNKPKEVTKKYLKELFAANQLILKFSY